MASYVAYGSLTIIDVNDIGEFTVQPMSNLPLAVIYDPDQKTFTPDWSSSNLLITPAVYYGGKPVTLGDPALTITWQRQEGVSGYSALTTGETVVQNGKLSVTANKFTASGSMLTYIVTATYVEPQSQQTLVAQGQISYTLVKNASQARECKITGDSIFKYNTSQTIVGATSITLDVTVTNVAIVEWQYLNSSGVWTKYPGSTTDPQLTVNATDATFVNDKCMIRVKTDNNDVYDIHTITKLRDGAAGSATVSGVLTNDDQMIPFDKNGTGDYSAATSRVIIYEGGRDTTASWTIAQSYDASITATASTTTKANDTVTVTGLTGSTGNVTFTCTRSGYTPITKVFSLVKVQSGADGVTPTVYSLEADSYALNKNINNVFSPANVTFTAYAQTGGNNKTTYAGRFQIFENVTLAEYDAAATKPAAKYSSTSNQSSYTYTPSTSATSILCILYAAGATTNRLDSQLVVVTSDGQTGQQGPQGNAGASAVNVILGNYADVFSCTNSNTLQANTTVTIPFAAYEGTTRIPCTATAVSLLGKSPTITNATASADGSIVYSFGSGTSVGAPSGTLTLTFTATASTGQVVVTQNYTWSRSTAAKNGENAVFLQIFTPSGSNIVNETVTSVDLQAQLMDGSTDKTSATGVTWAWAKFTAGAYNTISGATSSSYTVTGASVDSYASFRCTAAYNGGTYVAYFSVFDKTDPIQVTVMSSIGTQIVNGQGSGAIYAKVTRNGVEIDVMKSERFLTANPSGGTSGDFYYKIDETNKELILMKYTTSWVQASATEAEYKGNYAWTWRDKDGNVITVSNGYALPTHGKVLYIDGDMIDGKIIADVQVMI